MPVYQLIPVEKLVEPLNPQRNETLLARIDELRESIKSNGLQQPVGVQVEGENYRLLWGHRRSIAVTQLKWDFIPAMVYQADEQIDHDTLMGAENYHRNQTNDIEEARYYERILGKYPDGTIGLSRELNVPQSRVENLLATLRGNPAAVEALAAGKISLAQAVEINKFNTPGYQLHALEMASVEGKSADSLRRWRQDMHRQLQDQPLAPDEPVWSMKIDTTPTEPQDICNLGNHTVKLADRKYYSICHEHWNVILEGLEYYGMCSTVKQAGLWGDFLRVVRTAEKALEVADGRGDIQQTS